MALLQITGLEKDFGGLSALGGVDFHIDEGEVFLINCHISACTHGEANIGGC